MTSAAVLSVVVNICVPFESKAVVVRIPLLLE